MNTAIPLDRASFLIKVAYALFALVVLVAAVTEAKSASVHAPVAAYNEALRIVGGKRVVELPPKNGFSHSSPPGPNSNHYLIETQQGAMDCAAPHFEAAACRATSLGTAKAHRGYVAKVGARWLICPKRDTTAQCFVIGSGSLQPLATTWE